MPDVDPQHSVPFEQSSGPGRRHPLLVFYLLAFAIAWLGYGPLLAAENGVAAFHTPLSWLALALPGIAPGVAAWLTIRWGAERLTSSFAATLRSRVAPAWYGFALLVPIALVIASNLIAAAIGLDADTSAGSSPLATSSLALFTLVSILANPWEELGWRGFALPRLQARIGVVGASLVVSALWAAWHLPLFFLRSGPVSMVDVPVMAWMARMLVNTFALTWLFNRCGRSVAVVAIFHIVTNVAAAGLGVSSYGVFAATEALLVIALWAWRWPR